MALWEPRLQGSIHTAGEARNRKRGAPKGRPVTGGGQPSSGLQPGEARLSLNSSSTLQKRPVSPGACRKSKTAQLLIPGRRPHAACRAPLLPAAPRIDEPVVRRLQRPDRATAPASTDSDSGGTEAATCRLHSARSPCGTRVARSRVSTRRRAEASSITMAAT